MMRTVAKALTYRALGSGCTLLTTWLVTGSLPEAGAVTGLLAALKVAAYVLHDRAWSYVREKREERT